MVRIALKRRPAGLDRLTKSNLSNEEQGQLKKPNKRLSEAKNRLNGICVSLSSPTERYDPNSTAALILRFLDSDNRLPRILYSHFSNYIFSLNDEQRGIFDTNVECLLQYVTDTDVDERIKEFAIRIYDHCQLAKAQSENIEHVLKEGIADAQGQITNEAKKLEKEYISILGIFASVVLSFTAGIVFSSSVLENIASASLYRTVGVCILIGLVLMNLLFVLFHFIGVLAHENVRMKKWPMLAANGVLIAILIALFLFWQYGGVEKRDQSVGRELLSSSAIYGPAQEGADASAHESSGIVRQRRKWGRRRPFTVYRIFIEINRAPGLPPGEAGAFIVNTLKNRYLPIFKLGGYAARFKRAILPLLNLC